MCVPCALIAFAADGPSLSKLLADARRQDFGCDCATHAADAAPSAKRSSMPACPACNAIAVNLARDPNFLAVARRYPSLRLSLCPACNAKAQKVFGDDASDFYSTASDPQFAGNNSSVGPYGPLPAGSGTPPATTGPMAGNAGAYVPPASSYQVPPDQAAYYSTPGDQATTLDKALALAQQTMGIVQAAAKYGVPQASVAAASARVAAAPQAQAQAQQKTDKTWEIALGVGVALVVLYFVTKDSKPKAQQQGPVGGGPGPQWAAQ
jgi:hypothetical protein